MNAAATRTNFRVSDIAIALLIMGIVAMFIFFMPTWLMDIMLVINMTLSIVILLITLNIRRALDFSIFPSMLLITTIFRLALNVSSTKLILGNDGDAGGVIRMFGTAVIGNELVVGVIIFFIIVLVQFLVITKGAERVSEVAARFTLDAMPGKQMAIDADLNSGLIDEQMAKQRRSDIQREADFYGAMDGASKFVKGDAIMGIIITFVNIIGGIVMGLVMGDGSLDFMGVVDKYTLVTIGDGLVSQIPALLISTSMGIVVTRSASEGSMGREMVRQFIAQPFVLMMAAALLLVLCFVPGFPWPAMLLLAATMFVTGFLQYRAAQKLEAPDDTALDADEETANEKRRPENVTSLLEVHPIELELGYAIIPLLDLSQGGDLADRIVMIRRQCALDLGIIVPSIRLRDNVQIGNNEYLIRIKGVEISRGEVLMDHFMALNPGNATGTLSGIPTVEPAFGLPAQWITEQEREKADLYGYTTIDPPSVIATHMTEIVKRYGYELLSRQQVQLLLDNVKKQQPALVDEVCPKQFTLGEIQKILANLLRESIPVRDMITILETLSDYGGVTHDGDLLTEYCRQNLKRAISRRFVPDGKARVITLDPKLEQYIADHVRQTEHGAFVALEPDKVQAIFVNLKSAIERMTGVGLTPIVLTSPSVRRHFKRLTEQMVPDLTVLSYNELDQNIEIYSDWVVNIPA